MRGRVKPNYMAYLDTTCAIRANISNKRHPLINIWSQFWNLTLHSGVILMLTFKLTYRTVHLHRCPVVPLGPGLAPGVCQQWRHPCWTQLFIFQRFITWTNHLAHVIADGSSRWAGPISTTRLLCVTREHGRGLQMGDAAQKSFEKLCRWAVSHPKRADCARGGNYWWLKWRRNCYRRTMQKKGWVKGLLFFLMMEVWDTFHWTLLNYHHLNRHIYRHTLWSLPGRSHLHISFNINPSKNLLKDSETQSKTYSSRPSCPVVSLTCEELHILHLIRLMWCWLGAIVCHELFSRAVV